jgi:altronate hydrolase
MSTSTSTATLIIDPRDNVAVALRDLAQGELTPLPAGEVPLKEKIAAGHKLALADLAQGAAVIKYGHPIGRTTRSVAAGEWVHTHNLESALAGPDSYAYRRQPHPDIIPAADGLNFDGFLRPDGRAGIRNEIWIIVTVGCCNPVAEALVRESQAAFAGRAIDGIFYFPHPFGCSQLGGDLANTQRILAGLARHPNAGGVLVMGLGCENNHLTAFRQVLESQGELDPDRIRFYNLQEAEDEIDTGLELLEALVARAEQDRRQPLGADKLVLGMKCGGSDAFSGITANPLLGEVADTLIHLGGSAILTEVPEMFGAETILMDRCIDETVFDQTVSLINDFKRYFLSHDQPVYENPAPGNKAGGITTLEEKSLGCIRKGGRSPVVEVRAYGEQIRIPGLNLLNGPGNDIVSTTALAAAGAQIVLFTTGRGTPLGGPVPTLKVASNSELATRKKRWIDFDAGRLLSGVPMDRLTKDLLAQIVETASGRRSCRNEEMGSRQIAIFKDGVTL